MAQRRIKKQLLSYQNDPVQGCSIGIIDHNIFTWTAMIKGPQESPYAGGYFMLQITFPKDYPFKPPKCVFKTKIYHTNIHTSGAFCLDILKDQWSPALNIQKILTAIKDFMINPIYDNCCCIAELESLMKVNRQQYEKNAREWTEKYAK